MQAFAVALTGPMAEPIGEKPEVDARVSDKNSQRNASEFMNLSIQCPIFFVLYVSDTDILHKATTTALCSVIPTASCQTLRFNGDICCLSLLPGHALHLLSFLVPNIVSATYFSTGTIGNNM